MSHTAAPEQTHFDLPRTDHVQHPARDTLRRLRPVSKWLVRRRFAVSLHGADQVPSEGPVLLAANHVGVSDGPLLAIFTPRPVHLLTKVEMFSGPLGRMLEAAGQISVDRFNSDPTAVRRALRVLRDGNVVGIFPEGGRGSGELELFHRGAAYLAMVTGAVIVPISLIGTREPGGHTNSLPARGGTVDLVFGTPFITTHTPWPRTRAAVASVSRDLREHMIAELQDALALTGRTLPGPLPAGGEHEPDPGGGVTEASA